MSAAAYGQIRKLEYSILHDVAPAGPSIGSYSGQPIHESIIDMFGRRFVFVGVASRLSNGRFNAGALGTGEFILRPGLIYRMVSVK